MSSPHTQRRTISSPARPAGRWLAGISMLVTMVGASGWVNGHAWGPGVCNLPASSPC